MREKIEIMERFVKGHHIPDFYTIDIRFLLGHFTLRQISDTQIELTIFDAKGNDVFSNFEVKKEETNVVQSNV